MDIFLFTDNGDICCVHILINTYRREKVKGQNPISKEVDVTQAWSQLTLVIMVHQFIVHWVSIPQYWPNAHLFNIHVKNVTQHLSTLTIMCFTCIILLKLHQIDVVSPVMWMLYRSALVKRELSVKKESSVYLSICVPALAYYHKLWVVMEGRRSQIRAAKMSFLQR